MKIKMSQTCAWRRKTELAASSEVQAMNFHFRVGWYFIQVLLFSGIRTLEEVTTAVIFAKRAGSLKEGKNSKRKETTSNFHTIQL